MPRFGPYNRCVYRKITPHGYIAIRCPDHPRADPRGWVLEHILVAEAMLGGPLPPGAVVHHIDHDRRNNHPSNLRICDSQAQHMSIHAWERRRDPHQIECWPGIDQLF